MVGSVADTVKIFLVGSDAFSSREKAEAWAATIKDFFPRGAMYVKEAVVDDQVGVVSRILWCADMEIDTGKVCRSGISRSLARPEWETLPTEPLPAQSVKVVFGRSFVSEQHAIEEAERIRQQVLKLREESNASS